MPERTHSVAHHFVDPEQQQEADHFGMWIFLATEVLFFGGVITAYIVYRITYPEAFDEASRHTNLIIGGLNTAVLLSSSFTMALAVYLSKLGKRIPLVCSLLGTALLGGAFLGLKALEYLLDYREKLIPGINYALDIPHPAQGEVFFFLYFVMTLVHALHLTIGIFLILIMAVRAWKNEFNKEHNIPIEISGLYWHFVDVVWVFLFPMLYLINRTPQ